VLPCSSESLELLSLVVTCSEFGDESGDDPVENVYSRSVSEKLDSKEEEVVGLRKRKKSEGLMKKKVWLMTMTG